MIDMYFTYVYVKVKVDRFSSFREIVLTNLKNVFVFKFTKHKN
jgi:hypothetical protein